MSKSVTTCDDVKEYVYDYENEDYMECVHDIDYEDDILNEGDPDNDGTGAGSRRQEGCRKSRVLLNLPATALS